MRARRVAAYAFALAPLVVWSLMRTDPMVYPVIDLDQYRAAGWKFMGVALLAVLVPAVLLLRGQPQAATDLGVVAAIAFAGIVLDGHEVAAWLNARLDRARAIERTVEITGNERYGLLRVASWRPGRLHEEIPVPRSLYGEAHPGVDKLRFATSRGALGVEWVASAVLVPGERAPLTAGNRLWLGWEHMKQNRVREAEAEFRKALALDPGSFEARRYLDGTLAKQQRWPEILALWNDFLAQHPSHGGAYMERAGTHRHAGNMPAAMADLERACGLGEKGACEILDRQNARAAK